MPPSSSPSQPQSSLSVSAGYPRYLLAVLFGVALFSYLDRMILAILLEPIKAEFALSDTQLGLLSGLAFAVFYATFGIPLARAADVGNRRTIIAWSLAAWSALTMMCGMAQSFVQLLLARIGVAIGEAGAVPPSHSLLADYFPPEKRAGALSIFTLGSTVGYLIGFVLGGYVAENFGWRQAFLLVGFPGLLFALVVRFTVREPRDSEEFKPAPQDQTIWQAAGKLLKKRSYRFLLLGFSFYAILSYGANQWIASFLMRSHGLGIAEVGLKYGLVVSIATGLGVLAGGVICNRMYLKDQRWSSWVPALACFLAFPISLLAFTTDSANLAIAMTGLMGFFYGATTPPAMAAIHSIAGERRRALAVAFTFLMTNLIGLGLGPLLIGIISDQLAPAYAEQSLGLSILFCHGFLLLAAWFFYRAANFLPLDSEES